VEPFADQRLEQAIEAVEERSGYSVVGHEVVLRGACADCRP
jgi:Fe2+ or Zn2+ uptake regulation protein